jgi:hypothetical protein
MAENGTAHIGGLVVPIVELRRTRRTKPESQILATFCANITSQYGEDGVIAEILNRIGTRNRWCVEFGAWDGKYLSNTWSLINQSGWSAVLLEGDKVRAERLAASHAGNAGRVFVSNALVGWEGTTSLDSLLSATPIPVDFDVLSIDIDGNDWHVWNAVTAFRPRLVIAEFNSSASNDLYFIQDPDPTLNQGASLRAFVDLGRTKGYELVATTPGNAFFVTKEDFPKIGIADNSIDAIHEPVITTEIAQGYDGTIMAAGHMYLNWHGVALTQEDFQILPKSLRKYPDPGEK